MTEPVPKPIVGQIIKGKYELVRILGEGGMGVVFEAVHTKMRQRVAVKILLPELVGFEEVVERFEREARAAGQLRSRHAARVSDVDVTEAGLPYMVMEFLEGHDLGTELESRLRLPADEAVGYVLQACIALQEAHQLGIVHRDLKPANLFLARENNGQVVKLLDFGISKVVHEADRLTAADTVMGTAMYMSPEQVRSAKNVDGRSDVWSLGVILYELLCGQPPFLGTTTQIAAAIVSDDPAPMSNFGIVPPTGLEEIVRGALSRSPSGRPQTVRDFATALFPYAGVYGIGLEAFSQLSSRRLSLPNQVFEGLPSAAQRTEISGLISQPNIPSPLPLLTQGNWTGASELRRQKSRVLVSSAIALGVVLAIGALGVVRFRSPPVTGRNVVPRDSAPDTSPANVPRSSRPAVTSEPNVQAGTPAPRVGNTTQVAPAKTLTTTAQPSVVHTPALPVAPSTSATVGSSGATSISVKVPEGPASAASPAPQASGKVLPDHL